MKTYELKIVPLSEFEGEGNTVAYASKGTHDPACFMAALEAGWERTGPIDLVSHALYRVLPNREWHETPIAGPGAFPVTIIEADNVSDIFE